MLPRSAKFGRFRPKLADAEQSWTEVDQSWADFADVRPVFKFGRSRPKLGRCRPNLDRVRRIRPNIVGRRRTNSSRFRPNGAAFGQIVWFVTGVGVSKYRSRRHCPGSRLHCILRAARIAPQARSSNCLKRAKQTTKATSSCLNRAMASSSSAASGMEMSAPGGEAIVHQGSRPVGADTFPSKSPGDKVPHGQSIIDNSDK